MVHERLISIIICTIPPINWYKASHVEKKENDILGINKRYNEAQAALNAQIEELRRDIRRLEDEIWDIQGYTGETSIMDGMSDSATAQVSNLKAKKDYRDTRILYTTLIEGRFSDAMKAYKLRSNATHLHRLRREVYRAEHYLPSYLHRLEFETAIHSSRFVVVRGELGSGKSTQLPQYLADMPEFSDQIIICTQPRRFAAEMLAKRVSEEYQAKGPANANRRAAIFVPSARITPKSRIHYCTESHFLSLLTSHDAETYFLKVGAVVVDEAHERSVFTDVILGLLKTRDFCSRVKVVVTSASLDQEKFCRYLDRCPLISIPGAMFPVRVEYTQLETNYLQSDLVREALNQVMKIIDFDPPGDVLCFLTGQEEVERAKRELIQQTKQKKVISLCLYGRQTPKEMEKALHPPPSEHRKVIFATDVAETSITIEGLSYVVDMGLCKSTVYDAERNITSLRVIPISQSSADQRKGRVGRTKPGVCYRMFSKTQFDGFEKEKKPEILRRPLDVASAFLLSLDVDPFHFPWLDAPDDANLLYSFHLLKTHEAIDQKVQPRALPSKPSSVLTRLGRRVVLLQMDAGLVAGIDYAEQEDFLEAGLILASLAAHGGSTLYYGGSERQKARDCHLKLIKPGGDLATYFDIFLQWRSKPDAERGKWCAKNSINNKTMNAVNQNVTEMREKLEKSGLKPEKLKKQLRIDSSDRFPLGMQQKIILRMLKDNLAVQLRPNEFLVFCLETTDHPQKRNGVLGRLHRSSLLEPPNEAKWVTFHSLFTTNQTYLMQVTPVTLDMVAEVCGKQHADLIEKWESYNKIVPCVMHQISPKIQTELLGLYGNKKDSLINQLQCHDIENSPEELTLTVWATVAEISSVEDQLRKSLESIKSELLKQVGCISIPMSDVTIVFGAGLEVVEILFSDMILFPGLPDTLKEEELETIFSESLKTIFSESLKKPEKMVLELLRAESYNGATITFSSESLAECVKEVLKQEKSALLEKLGGKWISPRPLQSRKPRLRGLEIGFGLKQATSGRAGFIDYEKAKMFNFGKNTPVKKEWRKLHVLPQSDNPEEKYIFFVNPSEDDNEYFVRSRYSWTGSPQPDWVTIYRGQKGDSVNYEPSEIFPPILKQLVIDAGIPFQFFDHRYIRNSLWFSVKIGLHISSDLPSEVVTELKTKLDKEIQEGALREYKLRSASIIKTFSIRITLPAEVVYARKACLTNRLASFEEKSYYNKHQVLDNGLVYLCTSDKSSHLQTLQKFITSDLCRPTCSINLSPKLAETELGRHLIGELQASLRNFTFQPRISVVHVWTDTEAEVDSLRTQLERCEQSLNASNSFISAASSSEPRQLNNCSLCRTQLTEPEVILDICAHQFHSECLSRHVALASGREPIRCPCNGCDALLTFPELTKISKTNPYGDIKELAIGFYLKSHKETVIPCPGVTCSNIIKLRSEYRTLVAWCHSCDQIYCLSCAPGRSVVHTSSNPCRMSDYAAADVITEGLCPICYHAFHACGHPCSCCPCEGHYTYPKPKPSQHSQPSGRDDDRAVPSSSSVQSTPTQNTQQNVPTSSSSPPANQNSRTPPPSPSPPPQPPQSKGDCTLL